MLGSHGAYPKVYPLGKAFVKLIQPPKKLKATNQIENDVRHKPKLTLTPPKNIKILVIYIFKVFKCADLISYDIYTPRFF